MFGRKGLYHLGLRAYCSGLCVLVADLRPCQLLSSSTGCPGGGHLQPLPHSWTLLCDLQLAVTAAEKEPGELCRKEDILHLLARWSFPPEEQHAVAFFFPRQSFCLCCLCYSTGH